MKLGLSLAGGGVKGAAHIGVLKALEEENIKIDYISGTSSGSIVATLYAAGFTVDEIYSIFKKYCKQIKYIDICNIFKLIIGIIFKQGICIKGLNSGKKIEKLMNQICKEKQIENINQIKMPLLMPSVDVKTGKIYVFTSCLKKEELEKKNNRGTYDDTIKYVNDIEIGKAVRASCSYPGVFGPCNYKEAELIDGGIRENVPWKLTKELGADKVASVVFEKIVEPKQCPNIIEIIVSSIEIISHELSSYELSGADYLLKIKTSNIALLDYNKIDYLYEKGYQEAKKNIENFKKLCEKSQ